MGNGLPGPLRRHLLHLRIITGAHNIYDEYGGVDKRMVAVQGLRDRTVTDWLLARHGLLESMVDNRTSGKAGQTSERKAKAATNVRKA